MVAPIDAKVEFEVEGEAFTLRLNFRTLSLAKAGGVDLLAGQEMDAWTIPVVLRSLAVVDHPDMTEEDAFALALRHGEILGEKLGELFDRFGGETGNAPAPKRARRKKSM